MCAYGTCTAQRCGQRAVPTAKVCCLTARHTQPGTPHTTPAFQCQDFVEIFLAVAVAPSKKWMILKKLLCADSAQKIQTRTCRIVIALGLALLTNFDAPKTLLVLGI